MQGLSVVSWLTAFYLVLFSAFIVLSNESKSGRDSPTKDSLFRIPSLTCHRIQQESGHAGELRSLLLHIQVTFTNITWPTKIL